MSKVTHKLLEKFTLPTGIEVDGVIHTDVVLRPLLVRDSFEVMDDIKANENQSYMGLAMMARQITTLGTLTKEQITVELLMDAYEVDMAAITEGAEKLRDRLKNFRKDDTKPKKADTGTA